ncbi:MAG: sigma 54-interacting transcriptional regulator [Planctomycetes bacterium]|nr:sigma 54-interacting transcriptional regulator [Planctomycetota bacterium]
MTGARTFGPRIANRYRLIRPLGEGAGGDVYLARDEAHAIDVALKVFARRGFTATQANRFRHEFALRSTLTHPNLAQAYDFGPAPGGFYFTSEFIKGETLDVYFKTRRTPQQTCRVASDCLAALDHLHRQGLVHGDLHPRNILCSDQGVKLIDFGTTRPGTARDDLHSFGRTLETVVGPVLRTEPRVGELIDRLVTDVPGHAFPDAVTALAWLGTSPASQPRFIGREEELRRARQARVALIHGEEGSGKSAFVERLRVTAQLDEVIVGVARPTPVPLEALFRLLEELGPAGVDARRLRRRRANGMELRIAVTQAVINAARRHPILLIFEDLHALDPDSASFALHLAEMLPITDNTRARVALTWREAELAGGPHALTVARLTGERIRLGPLDVTSVAEARLGGVLSADLASQLQRATDGNGLLLDALLSVPDAFVQRDGAFHANRPLEVRVAAGFDALGGDARELAILLAATPGTLERRTLERFLDPPRLDAALVGLLRSGWIRPAGLDRWTIASAIKRLAVPESEREARHGALARALESFGGKPDLERLGAMAYHFARCGDPARARKYGLRFGIACERRHAHARAAETYERCADGPDAPEFLDLARRAWEAAANFPRMVAAARRLVALEPTAEMRYRLAESLVAAGELPEAIEVFRDAAKTHPEAERRLEALCEIARVHGIRREIQQMRSALEEAGTTDAGTAPPRVRAKFYLAHAVLAFLERDVDKAVPLLDQGIRAAQEDRDPKLLWQAWHTGGFLRCYSNPRYFHAERYLKAALRAARRAGRRFEAACSRGHLVVLDEVRGRLSDALEAKKALLDSAIASGHRQWIAHTATNLAATELEAGETAGALTHAQLGIKVAREIQDTHILTRAQAWGAIAHGMLGNLREGHALLRDTASEKTAPQDWFGARTSRRAELFLAWEAGQAAPADLRQEWIWYIEKDAPVDGALLAVLAATRGALSLEDVQNGLHALRAWPNKIAQARLQFALASALVQQGRHREARTEIGRCQKLAPKHHGPEALDVQRLLLASKLQVMPTLGAEFATRAYHFALERRRLRLAEEAAEWVGDLAMKMGNAQRAEHWYKEALRVFDDRRQAWSEEPEMKEHADRHGDELRQKVQGAHAAPPHQGWLRRLLELDRELLSASQKLPPLLRRVMDAMIELTGAERGTLLLLDRGELRPVACRNLDRMDLKSQDFRLSLTIAHQVLREDRPFTCADAQQDDRLRTAASVQEGRLHSVLCLPLRSGDSRIGAIYLDNRHRSGVFEMIDMTTVELFAERAALAIHNARLVDQLKKAGRQHRELAQKAASPAPKPADRPPELAPDVPRHPAFAKLLGESEPLRRAVHMLGKAAQSDAPVLLLGETGTGKELAARGVHDASPRAKKAFVAVNCAAIPQNMLESELFGHVKGAFTGADRDKMGLFQAAEGGTLFLDEIGELSPPVQSKLLRALQEHEIRKVGATASVRVDARIVAASNRDLQRMVKAGEFREDLYYRLKKLVVVLPPLRERREDIPALVHEFLRRLEGKHGTRTLTPEAAAILIDYGWPGNVRELEGVIEACVLLSDRAVEADLVRAQLRVPSAIEGDSLDMKESVAKTERALVVRALQTSKNIVHAAKRLGIPRAQLYRLIERHKIKV